MGFDKLGRSDFKIPVSDTQAYQQFGNAVVVLVVEKIIEHIIGKKSNDYYFFA